MLSTQKVLQKAGYADAQHRILCSCEQSTCLIVTFFSSSHYPQPCIDRLERDDTGAEVELVGERAVELIRNRKRVLTRIVFTPQHSGVTGILLSWFAARLLKIF